jgi:PPOX class probable F420-dependent enzyme
MEISEALDFVRANHHAVLATVRRDGTPQQSPVTVGVDRAGTHVVVSVTQDRAKTKNLLRDPRAFLCVFTDGFYGPWVQVRGEAEIVPMPEALDLLVDYYRDISGEHPDWDEFREAMVRDRRVVARIRPTHVVAG